MARAARDRSALTMTLSKNHDRGLLACGKGVSSWWWPASKRQRERQVQPDRWRRKRFFGIAARRATDRLWSGLRLRSSSDVDTLGLRQRGLPIPAGSQRSGRRRGGPDLIQLIRVQARHGVDFPSGVARFLNMTRRRSVEEEVGVPFAASFDTFHVALTPSKPSSRGGQKAYGRLFSNHHAQNADRGGGERCTDPFTGRHLADTKETGQGFELVSDSER